MSFQKIGFATLQYGTSIAVDKNSDEGPVPITGSLTAPLALGSIAIAERKLSKDAIYENMRFYLRNSLQSGETFAITFYVNGVATQITKVVTTATTTGWVTMPPIQVRCNKNDRVCYVIDAIDIPLGAVSIDQILIDETLLEFIQ